MVMVDAMDIMDPSRGLLRGIVARMVAGLQQDNCRFVDEFADEIALRRTLVNHYLIEALEAGRHPTEEQSGWVQ